jgi:hypothetical protein
MLGLTDWVKPTFEPIMTTIVLPHPNPHCPQFQVFGVHDGPNDRFTFDLHEFEDRDLAKGVARKLMEVYGADHFRRVIPSAPKPIG